MSTNRKSRVAPSGELPLAGVRVLDLTHVGAGPFCTSLLGQLGADVVKIERLGIGEMMRAATPYIGDGTLSYYFASVNVEKRYIQLDLRSKPGQSVLRQLIRRSDVLVQNFGSGVVGRFGADARTARRLNPRLIHCSIVGFREGSKYSGLPSFDYIHEAMAGVMAMTGYPGQAPPLPGLPAADMSAGLYAILGVVLALRMRETTGRGQTLEVPLQDSLLSLLPLRLGYSFATGREYPPFGRFHRDFAPFGVFDTKDSLIILTVGSQELWERLVAVMPELDHEQFRTLAQRVERKDELHSLMNQLLKDRTTAEWIDVFNASGVPAAPVMTTADVATDSYTQEISRHLDIEGGEFQWIPYPVKSDVLTPRISRPPGPPGMDTRAVLLDIGYTDNQVDRLQAKGVINS